MSFIQAKKITGSIGSEPSLLKDGLHVENSALLTAGIIVADVVGAGILSIPSAVANYGWLLGSLAMVFLLILNVHVGIKLWKIQMTFREVGSMHGLCCAVFDEDSPAWQRWLMPKITVVSQYAFFISLLGAYSLSWGQGLGMIFYDVHIRALCLPQWVAIGALMLLPFHLTARKLGKWDFLVWVNIGSLLGTIFIPLIWFALTGADELRNSGVTHSEVFAVNPLLTPKLVMKSLGIFTFAFTSQFMLIEIMSEMKDKAELPKAYACIASPFMVVVFLLVGCAAYYYLGSDLPEIPLPQMLPFGTLYRLAGVCLCTHMLISYLIKGIVTCYGVHKAWHPDTADKDDPDGWKDWYIVVCSLFVVAYLIANSFPFFNNLVGLLGDSLTPISCWIMPLIMFTKWHNKYAEKNLHVLEWILIACELALGIVLCFYGTYVEVAELIDNWAGLGAPFACHCQELWNTCACTPHNHAMNCPNPAFFNSTIN